jgi:hypothetical protein
MTEAPNLDPERALFAGAGDPARYDLAAIRDLDAYLTGKHTGFEGLASQRSSLDGLLRILLRVMRSLEASAGKHGDRSFPFAAVLLLAKVFSHTESIRILIDVGRYGDAVVVLRAVVSDVRMLQYLAVTPDDVPDWIDAAEVRPQPYVTGSRRKELAEKFQEKKIRNRLQQSGAEPYEDLFQGFSEASHGSLWGMRYFLNDDTYGRSRLAEGSIRYGGLYQLHRALDLTVVSGLLLITPLSVLFEWCQANGETWHLRWVKAFEQQSERLRKRHSIALEVVNALLSSS